MEARVAQIPIVDVEDEESDPLNVFPPSQEGSPQLPHDLFGDADDDQLSSRVRDSVASSLIPDTSKGKAVLPPWEKKPELVVERMQGTVPEFTERSRAAPATQMASHMGPDPQTGTVGTSGGVPVVASGVGQMKLDPPPRYSGGRRPGARVWLSQMERYMRLMEFPAKKWLDIVAMRVDGSASTWINAQLAQITRGQRPRFVDWDDFQAAMIAAFEPVTETEEARKQLRALRQTGKVANYIQKFQELEYRLPG